MRLEKQLKVMAQWKKLLRPSVYPNPIEFMLNCNCQLSGSVETLLLYEHHC